MGETLLTLTILTLVILTIRRARPVVLENPVTIDRPGKYQIILAPQLNRAQTFIEQIAKPYLLMHPPQADLPTQYYEVRDPIVYAKGESVYLLAVSLRNGMMYFQAANPDKNQASHLATLQGFSEPVLKQHPLLKPAEEQWAEKLRDTVHSIADTLKISVTELKTSG